MKKSKWVKFSVALKEDEAERMRRRIVELDPTGRLRISTYVADLINRDCMGSRPRKAAAGA